MKILIFLSLAFWFGGCESDLRVGQTWLYKINADNPFEKPKLYHQKIIDIKGDYVQYVENGKDTLSSTKYWFLLGVIKEN